MSAIASVIPPLTEPIIDGNGMLTKAWRRHLEAEWNRSGGFGDALYALLLAGNTGDATIGELAAQSDENRVTIEGLRVQIDAGVIEGLQQDATDIRQQMQNLTALVQGGLSENLQQQIEDLQQEINNLNAQIQSVRGEDNAAAVQVVNTVVVGVEGQVTGLATVARTGAYSDLTGRPSLATVATSGAYSDLTGRPSLATVATTGAYSDLTGKPSLATVATSGDYNDLINKPVGSYTATPITALGYMNITDSGGTVRRVLVG